MLLSADLSYGTATDLTLAFDAGSPGSEYQLLDSSNQIVSSADAVDAATGGIVITGTDGNDSLTLDLTTLFSETKVDPIVQTIYHRV